MTAFFGFFFFLGLTVVLLLLVAWTGHKHLRKPHVFLVINSMLSLGVAIYYAIQLGKEYDLEAAGWITPVHMKMAKVATVAYVVPITLGILTWRRPKWLRLHGMMGLTVILLTVLTTVTGAIMLYLAEPIIP
ncbi:MAG: hypothetical protein ACI8QC_003503 [Planctomycetota bacterium]|jgi:hypothetical protein